MVEVMVALVLLAAGLLGAAYMQNYSLRFGQESYHRSQLMVGARELIDSMRTFHISPDDGSGDEVQYTTPVSAAEAAAGCDPTASTPRNDTICFYQNLANSLPFGTANIAVQAVDANTSLFNVSVFWSDRGLTAQSDLSDANQTASDINLATQGDCNAEDNRRWSNGLAWPFGNGPDTPTCLMSHTWSVQILNPEDVL